MVRRERLERFAIALDRHDAPVNLFSQLEYLPRSKYAELRGENSPLAIAFSDPVLRASGLASDRLGDAAQFFDLSAEEAHHLFCDCHYSDRAGAQITSRMMAGRVRAVAARMTFAEMWDKARSFLRL